MTCTSLLSSPPECSRRTRTRRARGVQNYFLLFPLLLNRVCFDGVLPHPTFVCHALRLGAALRQSILYSRVEGKVKSSSVHPLLALYECVCYILAVTKAGMCKSYQTTPEI